MTLHLDPNSEQHQGNWLEQVDDASGIVLRRMVVGPLATNCFAITPITGGGTILIDPGDDARTILNGVSDLDVRLIVLTHAHFDHVLALAEVADALGTPIAAHPADAPVWPHELAHLQKFGHFDAGTATTQLLARGCALCPAPDTVEWDGRVDRLLRHGDRIELGLLGCTALHTPGHTPGGLSLLVGRHVFTGDTLFPGGPGLTGWPLSDFPTIIESIRTRLLSLDPATAVHPGHGPSTTIAAQRPQLDEWIRRGW
jgi:hydroxyacylglutathione hydrolase